MVKGSVLIKVEEAKTKVCPFIQSVVDFCYADGAFNNQKPKNITCICGDCIAWDFYVKRKENGDVYICDNEGQCLRICND